MRRPGVWALGACLMALTGLLCGTPAQGDGDQWRNHQCSVQGYSLHQAHVGKKTFWLCLMFFHIGTTSLASANSAILLDPDAEVTDTTVRGLPLNVTLAKGYVLGHRGSAEGYIGHDDHFYGVLHLDNMILHADPYNKDDRSRAFGPFEPPESPPEEGAGAGAGGAPGGLFGPEGAEPGRVRREYQYSPLAQEIPYALHFPFTIEDRKRVPGVARARVCELLLLADKEFFERDANASLEHVVRRMVHAVAQADIIFRNTDFNEDGEPDNIGFSVKYILVLTSEETNTRVFGDLLQRTEIDGKQYLMRFARVRRLSEVCLGVAFSGHAFRNRTLGLSFTSLGGGMGGAAGGLCDRRAYGRSFNTLALAHATAADTERVPERIAALTLTHEMGHSFGAHHDDNFPNPECRGFLMGSQSSTADASRHFEFSICSKRLIAATLHSMSYCLVDEDKPYCGNGIVEKGERCDCGMPSSCNLRDQCCTPRAGGALVYDEGSVHVDGCEVSPAALCHPSQGLCCTATCSYADLSAHGIDCSTMSQQCDNCQGKNCRCGLGGRCLPDGSCHAAECALLGLRECQCRKNGAGGTIGNLRMCGVCCLLESKEGFNFGTKTCVGAELAVRAMLDSGARVPPDWPENTYNGPNVSVKVCSSDNECLMPRLRAWPAGGVCVARNTVGFCSLAGVCKPGYATPRPNVFPTIMQNMKVVTALKSSHTNVRTVSVKLLIFCVIFVVK